MPLVNAKPLFEHALKNHYGIGAFNFINYETLKGILDAAKKHNSPVIIQTSVGALKYGNIKVLKGMVHALCDELTIPVCWNLDHGKTFEDCKLAVDNGFTNVMIDASDLPYEENISLTKKVVEYAHAHGVTVEGELGTLKGIEDEVNVADEHAFYTNPDQAKDFVTRTGVDSLAIAIGTSHGAYKFKGDANLKFDILSEIEAELPNFPLVLHGASSIPARVVTMATQFGANLKGVSGVPEEILFEACKRNICKVNVDSDLRISFLAGIRKHIAEHPENIDIRGYLTQGTQEIQTTVEEKLVHVFNSANKAW